MNNKHIKHGILIFLGFLTIKMNIHFGDYCFGAPDVIQWLFFSFIFIVVSISVVIYELIKRKNNSKTYIIISIVILLNLIFITLQFNKTDENKDTILIGHIDDLENDKQITLNENKSFIIKIQKIEWSCYKKGDYEIKDSILILKKENLIPETDSIFTYKYKIDLKTKRLIPLEKGFNIIKILSTKKLRELCGKKIKK